MARPVALVTGASRGIGKASCLALARSGHDLVACARTVEAGDQFDHRVHNPDGSALPGSLEETRAEVEELGVDVLTQRLDLLDRASMDAAVAGAIDRFGRIDVLVNNAIYQGEGLTDDFLEGSLDAMARVFEGNVLAQVYLTRLVLPHMFEKGGGIIINMTSAAGMTDPPVKLADGGWSFAHGATKAALHRMAGILQLEYGDRGIRAYNLEPGLVRSESLIASMGEVTRLEALGIPSAPVEVPGAVVAWLATDPEAEALAGQNVHAQPFCAKRKLLDGWPPPEPA